MERTARFFGRCPLLVSGEQLCPSMEESGIYRKSPASFWTQTNALMRKNITFQRRNIRTNIGLVGFPVLLCLLLVGIQKLVINIVTEKPGSSCECHGCSGEELKQGNCSRECWSKVFDMMGGQVSTCPESQPTKWPALFQIPRAQFRAARRKNPGFDNYYSDLPHESCRERGSCPVTILLTGTNKSLARSLGNNLFGSESFPYPSDSLDPLTVSWKYILGTSTVPASANYFEPAFVMFGGPPSRCLSR